MISISNWSETLGDVNIFFDRANVVMTDKDIKSVEKMYELCKDMSDKLFNLALSQYIAERQTQISQYN